MIIGFLLAIGNAAEFDEWGRTQSLAHPDRMFRVRGKLQPDMEKLNLRLRIVEPEGAGLACLSCASV